MGRRRNLPTNVLTPAMIADRWGTSDTFVYDLIRAGRLSAFRLGEKLWRITIEAVEEFECHKRDGRSASSQDDELTVPATGISVSNGLTAEERTASRLARLIDQPQKPRLVSSGTGGALLAPTQSVRS